jgi:hypothetical protein
LADLVGTPVHTGAESAEINSQNRPLSPTRLEMPVVHLLPPIVTGSYPES